MTKRTDPHHGKRQGYTLKNATHCADCNRELTPRRRALIHDVGVFCLTCYAARWQR